MNQGAQFVVLQLLRAYQWAVSPLLPPACRYVPTCSEYAMEAVERYGALRGGGMALKRLLRCHPLGRSGYDPVLRSPNLVNAEILSGPKGTSLHALDIDTSGISR